jgi:hypothetical protein
MMPSNFNLYSAWTDSYFYVWAAVFAGALFAMVYSIRRYLELKNAASLEEEPEPLENPFLGEPAPAPEEEKALDSEPPAQPAAADIPDAEKTLVVPPPFPAEPESGEAPAPQAAPVPAPAHEEHGRAENFVRGIYAGITDLDERMKGIEEALSKGRVNNDFAVKFLEDMLQDLDALDKAKIKARIEYLLSDLKK